MLDKRRLYASGSPPCTLIFVVALAVTGCISLWLHIENSGAFISPYTSVGSAVSANRGAIGTSAFASVYPIIQAGNTTSSPHPYSLNELPSDDRSTLIDLKDFRFTMNRDPCNKSSQQQQPLLLMLVHSAPGNAAKRNVVRETWGRQIPDVVLLFLVGASVEYQAKLEEEDRKYRDLVQGNFVDSYKNMTYKHVMALKWATYHCPDAKYVLKLDDDVFVHVTAMLDFLKHFLPPWGPKRLILCDVLSAALVKRSWRSKWRVSPQEYPATYYPSYCPGWAILYTLDSVFLLYREAQKEPYFWIDDVHVTGTLAKKVNLTQASLHTLVLTSKDMRKLFSESRTKKDFLLGPPELTEVSIRSLYNLVTKSRPTSKSLVNENNIT